MALFYKAVKSTMATKSGDKKWHLNLVKVGKVVSTQQLAEMIAEKSSLTPGDVHNVVRNLMTAMRSADVYKRQVINCNCYYLCNIS